MVTGTLENQMHSLTVLCPFASSALQVQSHKPDHNVCSPVDATIATVDATITTVDSTTMALHMLWLDVNAQPMHFRVSSQRISLIPS